MAFTFNGENILGEDFNSVVHAGTPLAKVETFTMPGVRGEFEHRQGTAGRPIVVQAAIRAASCAVLETIEQKLAKYAAAAGTYTLVDEAGVTYTNCTLRTATPVGPRETILGGEGKVWQDWFLEFRQLDPTIGS